MRKCKGYYVTYNSETHRHDKNDFELGYFHQFGNAFYEFESGAGNYTTAIVELPDGKVVEAVIDSIQFLNDNRTGD